MMARCPCPLASGRVRTWVRKALNAADAAYTQLVILWEKAH
jgi:hypothetical protein